MFNIVFNMMGIVQISQHLCSRIAINAFLSILFLVLTMNILLIMIDIQPIVQKTVVSFVVSMIDGIDTLPTALKFAFINNYKLMNSILI